MYHTHSGETSVGAMNVLDAHLGTILQHVRLNYLLEREEGGWDTNLNWEDILSLGEQQRLGMVSDPQFVSSVRSNINF